MCSDPFDAESCHERTVRAQTGARTYGYDAVGNRTDSGAVLLAAGNRYSAFAGFTLAYDADGNLTRKQKSGFDQRLYWNALGQLDSVVTSGVKVSYGYNAFGMRVRRTEGAAVTRMVYDGDDLLFEVDGGGALLREYVYYPGIDQPHALRVWTGGTSRTYYYAVEAPGHVMGVFDDSARAVARYHYDPWGRAESATVEAIVQPLRFMARELDARTGLYYVRNRWYDVDQGRFVSEDPIGLEGGINLYAYASNDPLHRLDPYGLTDDTQERCEKMFTHIADPIQRGGLVEWCVRQANFRESSVRGPYAYNPGTRGAALYCGGSMCYAPPINPEQTPLYAQPGGWGSTGSYPNMFIPTKEQAECGRNTMKVVVGTTLLISGWGGVRGIYESGKVLFKTVGRGGMRVGISEGMITFGGLWAVFTGLDDIGSAREACAVAAQQPVSVGYRP